VIEDVATYSNVSHQRISEARAVLASESVACCDAFAINGFLRCPVVGISESGALDILPGREIAISGGAQRGRGPIHGILFPPKGNGTRPTRSSPAPQEAEVPGPHFKPIRPGLKDPTPSWQAGRPGSSWDSEAGATRHDIRYPGGGRKDNCPTSPGAGVRSNTAAGVIYAASDDSPSACRATGSSTGIPAASRIPDSALDNADAKSP